MPLAPNGTEYDIDGAPDAPWVIFIHGLGLNQQCWQWTTPALADGYRILTYDLFGHGDTVNPPQTPNLTLFSRQLQQVMDHCGIQEAAIVGFSLGGMIARRFAQDVPARARALAILHSPHKRSPEAQAAILARVDQARDHGPQATVEAALERWFSDSYRASRPDMMDIVRSWVMANRIDVYPSVYRVLAEGVDEIVAPDPPISCPALVMTGDEDYGNGPEMTQAIAEEISGAQTLILKGLRHMALAEDPDAINTPLRAFLDRHVSGDPDHAIR